MLVLSVILVGVVALEHIYIVYLEMFAWGGVTVKRSILLVQGAPALIDCLPCWCVDTGVTAGRHQWQHNRAPLGE